MTFVSSSDMWAIAPLLTVMLFGMIVLMVDLFLPPDRKSGNVVVSLIGLAIALILCGRLWGTNATAFAGTVVADDFALMFQAILIVVAALGVMLSEKYVQQKGINYGEYYALMLFSTSGAMLMATSRELITIFVGLEVLSIALYVLSGFARTEARSEESAMKYFLLGAFSSGFFLYGIALVYGGTGTTLLNVIPQALRASGDSITYTVAGIALLIVGLGFKAALVPFHSWTPDVYEGAPTSVTAFMSAGAKCGAFAAFVRVANTALVLHHTQYAPAFASIQDVLWLLAALTMVLGNVLAIVQSNIKRMLAYSSIAHAGYITVGLLAQNAQGHAGILFYVLAYTFMNLGAFGVLILLARRGEELNTISDLQGLASRQPGAAAMMAVFMLSLGGIPPTAGFMGKLYLFLGAVQAHYIGLAVIGLVASVIGVAYYLRIIWTMYFQPAQREYPSNVWSYSLGATVALGLSVFFTLLLGVYSTGLFNYSLDAAQSLDHPASVAPIANAPAVEMPAAPVASAQ